MLEFSTIIMVIEMDCVFCKIINGELPSYKIYEDEKIMAFLDINPNSPGHTLIIPKEHVLDLCSISDEMLHYIMSKARDIAELLTQKLDASGFSLVQNNGSVQEVKHFHLHIIPKYSKQKRLSIEKVYEKITQ